MQVYHFSDPHVGGWLGSFRALFDKRLFGAMNYNLIRKKNYPLSRLEQAVQLVLKRQPKVLVLSGDLTSVGDPHEFDDAYTYLQPLITSSVKILFVPGNHDHYCRDRRSRMALEGFCEKIGAGLYHYSKMPQVVKIGLVEFVLLNEAEPSVVYRSNGYLREQQLEFIQSLPAKSDANPRIFVGHYPMRGPNNFPLDWRRSLIGGEQLRQMIAEGIGDLALCGHIHTPFINKIGNSAEICAGSITKYAHINVLDIDEQTCRIAQHWETIDNTDDGSSYRVNKLFSHLEYRSESSFCYRRSI